VNQVDSCELKLRHIIILVIALVTPQLLQAQDECGDECKTNTNFAAVVNAPVNPTAQVAGTGWGLVAGTGFNFNRRNSVIGEFMWNRIYPLDGALQPLKAALQSSDLSGNSNLYALTGNFRFELRGWLLGTYFIGGGGWYSRNTNLSKEVTSGTGTICTSAWLWWGFTCTSGTVTAGQTEKGSSSNAFGGNAGIGFTVRVGKPPYRLYSEARYHYAPAKSISTQVIAIASGIRF